MGTQNKNGLLIEIYFLLVLFLNLEYRHIRTNTHKHKFAHALYILKCNYFPDSFFYYMINAEPRSEEIVWFFITTAINQKVE